MKIGLRMSVPSALVAMMLAGACTHPRAAAGPGVVPDPCAGMGADTAGWQGVNAGPFRFAAPREYRQEPVQGMDSFVGRWRASRGRLVTFDYGMYSSALDEVAARPGFRECTAEIGGKRVRVVAGHDARGELGDGVPGYVVAAAWRDVSPGTHLSMMARGADAADLPVLLAIVRSVRFDSASSSVTTPPGR